MSNPSVVLHAAVDVVRQLVIHADVVVLGEREVGDESPGVSAVLGDRDASVVPDDDVPGVARVDPHRVVIRVDVAEGDELLPGLARVVGNADARPQAVHAVRVLRVDPEVGVVERAVAEVLSRPGVLPAPSSVGRPVEAVLLRLDEGVHDLRRRPGDPQSDAAQISLGKPVLRGEPRPAFSSVARHVQARARAARLEEPGPTPVLPHRREHDIRVVGVHDEVGGAGFLIDVQDLLPRLRSVARAKDPTLRILTPLATHRGDVGHLRIRRIQHDPGDPLAALQSQVLPCLASVAGPVDAVSDRDAVADVSFARPDPEHIGVARMDGKSADRRDRLIVEDRLEGETSAH